MRNLVNSHPTTQNSKHFTLMGYSCQKYMRFELKKYKGVIFHDTLMKSDAKFEEKLTLGSKNHMRNLVNFNLSSGNSENLHFDVLLLEYQVLAKKSTKLSIMTLKKDPNFEEKLTFYLENDMSNLVNVNLSSGKSNYLHFDGPLF